MANVSLTPDPSYYLDPTTAQWVISDDVDYISFTTNGSQPAISEYIAYDQLVPPNPFIAVTQDGRGNVVYDGGFPKFYNNTWNGAVNFSQLTASHKYLYNALNFCANPAKVASGNKTVLVLGDTLVDAAYPVKGTGPNGFRTLIANVLAVAGYVPTFKDLSDYGGAQIKPTLAELNAYSCVLMFSTAYALGNPVLIPPSSVTDMVAFREAGNGLIFITDHGSNVQSDINQVTGPNGVGFYATANRVMVNFGAFFTGNYDRSPVNVGFLRANYGDHPLYNGMLNSDSISAGGSESKVIVATFPKYTKDNIPPVVMTNGRYVVQILVMLKDKTIETGRFVYTIATGDIIVFENLAGDPISSIDVGFSKTTPVSAVIKGAGLGTLTGDVLLNGIKVATLTFTEAGGSVLTWNSGHANPQAVNNGDVFKARVTAPFTYAKDLTIVRKQPLIQTELSLARVLNKLQPLFPTAARKDLVKLTLAGCGLPRLISVAANIKALRNYFKP